jgi:hypothetical protein
MDVDYRHDAGDVWRALPGVGIVEPNATTGGCTARAGIHPVAVLSAIVVPMAFIRDGEWAISFDNPFLLASIIAIFIAWTSRNLLLTILLGMTVFLLLKWWL